MLLSVLSRPAVKKEWYLLVSTSSESMDSGWIDGMKLCHRPSSLRSTFPDFFPPIAKAPPCCGYKPREFGLAQPELNAVENKSRWPAVRPGRQ